VGSFIANNNNNNNDKYCDRRAPGCEKEQQMKVMSGYDAKKLAATKAMREKPSLAEVRRPNAHWAGFSM